LRRQDRGSDPTRGEWPATPVHQAAAGVYSRIGFFVRPKKPKDGEPEEKPLFEYRFTDRETKTGQDEQGEVPFFDRG
jgi:hypothetical protein